MGFSYFDWSQRTGSKTEYITSLIFLGQNNSHCIITSGVLVRAGTPSLLPVSPFKMPGEGSSGTRQHLKRAIPKDVHAFAQEILLSTRNRTQHIASSNQTNLSGTNE